MKLRTGFKILPVLGALAAPLAFEGVRASGNAALSEMIAGVATDVQRQFVEDADKSHFEGKQRKIREHQAADSMMRGFFYAAAQNYLELGDRNRAQIAFEKFVESMEADPEKAKSNLLYLKEAYKFLGKTEKAADMDKVLKAEEAWGAEKRDDFDRAIVLYAELGNEDRVKSMKAKKAEALFKDTFYAESADLYEEIGMTEKAKAVYRVAGEKHLYDEDYARECFSKAGLSNVEADAILGEYEAKQRLSIAAMRREARAGEPVRKKEELKRVESEKRWKAESLTRAVQAITEGDLDNAYFGFKSAGWTDEAVKAKIDPLKREKAESLALSKNAVEKNQTAILFQQVGELERARDLYLAAAEAFKKAGDLNAAITAFGNGGDKVAASKLYRVFGNKAREEGNCARALDYYSYAAKAYPPSLGGRDSLEAPLRTAAECAAEEAFESYGWRGEESIKDQLGRGGYSEKGIAQWQGTHWLETDSYRALAYYKDAKDCSGIVKASLEVYKDDMTSCMSHNGFWNVSQCANVGRNLMPFKEIEDCL